MCLPWLVLLLLYLLKAREITADDLNQLDGLEHGGSGFIRPHVRMEELPQ